MTLSILPFTDEQREAWIQPWEGLVAVARTWWWDRLGIIVPLAGSPCLTICLNWSNVMYATTSSKGLEVYLSRGLWRRHAPLPSQRVWEAEKTDYIQHLVTQSGGFPNLLETTVESDHHRSMASIRDAEDPFAHSFFERAAVHHGSKIALEDEDGNTLTFAELNQRANPFAALLHSRQLGPGDVIALFLERSINAFVVVYGILKAGAGFCALDPANPPAKSAFILQEINAVLRAEPENASPDTAPPCYILYTSGSTGFSKGALIPHFSIAASIEGMIEATHTTSDWRSLWILNYVFDGSYFDVFAVLASGRTVCIASKGRLVADMTACINKMRCTHIFITPSIAGALQPQEMPQLTVLIVGGEAPHAALRDVWAPRMKVYSAYGPTECAIFVTVKLVTPAESRLTTLGERTKHAELSIRALDSANLVTEGKIGGLCIGGVQVGGGYLTRPGSYSRSFHDV